METVTGTKTTRRLLLQRDESGGVGGSNTGSSVLNRLVGDGELSQIVADHLWLDLHLGEDLPVVDTNNGVGHLRDHHHVPQVGLHNIGLLVDGSGLLLLTELLDQSHWLALHSSGELAPDPAGEELHQTLIVHVEELVEIHTTVGVFAEGSLLLQLGGLSVSHAGYFLSLVEVNQAILAW